MSRRLKQAQPKDGEEKTTEEDSQADRPAPTVDPTILFMAEMFTKLQQQQAEDRRQQQELENRRQEQRDEDRRQQQEL